MEAYCKAVRALEDKFYGIELNHVRTSSPRSRRGGSPVPRTSLREMSPSRPSTSSPAPRAARNPWGLP
jgi:hypothetical protein